MEEYLAPKSVCSCGHTGDGPDSDHGNSSKVHGEVCPGHGPCSVPGCKCDQFAWRCWTPQFQTKLDIERDARLSPKYPIYKIRVDWTQDCCQDHKRDNDTAPEGKISNGTMWYHMTKEEMDVEDYEKELVSIWWLEFLNKNSTRIHNPSTPKFKIELEMRETWCGGWFEHWTFDTFSSDTEVLDSFQAYVDRMTEANRKNPDKTFCLMGAEERHRWRGSTTGEAGSGDWTNPPCRCEGCKKRGIVRIIH